MKEKLQKFPLLKRYTLKRKSLFRKLGNHFSLLSAFAVTIFVQISFPTYAQDHVLAWATSVVGGSGDNLDEAKAIATDATGNVISTGLFRVTADFDPGTNEFNLTSSGGTDVFVQKLDKNGSLLWAKRVGGTSDEIGRAIATDADGNIYVSGPFKGTTNFDPGASDYELTSKGDNDIFVLKLAANGDFLWAKSIGGTTGDDAKGVAVDVSGNVYITGFFTGQVEFDPNHNPATPSTTEFVSSGGSDIFVLKLSSAGNYLWAKKVGSTSSDIAYAITTDATGNIYTTGHFAGTVEFNPDYVSSPSPSPSQLISSGNNDIFIQKLGSDGSFIWAKKIGGTGNDIGYGIVTDVVGNIYTTGQFNGTVEFDPNYVSSSNPSTTELISAGGNDVFVQKLTGNGDLIWAKAMGGTGSDIANGIAVDALGNVYTTGAFNGTADFDPGSGKYDLVAVKSNSDTFISKLGSDGAFVWAKGVYDTLTGGGYGIAVDANNNIAIAGSFGGSVDFDPGVGTTTLISAGTSRDIYVMKLKPDGVTPVELTYYTVTADGNKAKLNWQTASEQNNSHFSVYRSTDGKEFILIGEIAGAGTSNDMTNYVFYDKHPQQGTNYYRLVQIDKNGIQTVEGERSLSFKISEAMVVVFPNPASHEISVQFQPGKFTDLDVLDANGKIFLAIKVSEKDGVKKLDIAQYPSGIYFLKLSGDAKTEVFKLVKL